MLAGKFAPYERFPRYPRRLRVQLGNLSQDSIHKYLSAFQVPVRDSATEQELVIEAAKHFDLAEVNEEEVLQSYMRRLLGIGQGDSDSSVSDDDGIDEWHHLQAVAVPSSMQLADKKMLALHRGVGAAELLHASSLQHSMPAHHFAMAHHGFGAVAAAPHHHHHAHHHHAGAAAGAQVQHSPAAPAPATARARPADKDKDLPQKPKKKARVAATDEGIAVGTRVVARAQDDWILARVTAYNARQKQYTVEDDDDTEKKAFSVPPTSVIQLPPDSAEVPELPKGARVLALFPDSTCFYPGNIVSTLKAGIVGVCFDDDEDKGRVVRKRNVNAAFVVAHPITPNA